jgi:DNA mismatch repair ATPase MutS
VVAVKLGQKLVENDFTFDQNGAFYVLSGPNRGGKSVISCAVGLNLVLAELGLIVCASEAIISPADAIFTHFPTGSEDTIDKGRLGEECARLYEIFERVTGYSLVLLDETLSSTGSYEGSYIASEVLSGFSMVKCRGIFSTHLHELASMLDEINERCEKSGGARIDTLVAGMEEGQRSFKISRKKPDGRSYARDIADKYGISLDSILKKIEKNK